MSYDSHELRFVRVYKIKIYNGGGQLEEIHCWKILDIQNGGFEVLNKSYVEAMSNYIGDLCQRNENL